MRAGKRVKLELQILAELRLKEIDVQCGECHAVVRACWKACVVRNAQSWIARSEVECACGCTLHSYLGDALPVSMVGEHFELLGVEGKRSGPVMSFVRRAIGTH
jgi:hypothetical protein